jgi:hypothetical protein
MSEDVGGPQPLVFWGDSSSSDSSHVLRLQPEGVADVGGCGWSSAAGLLGRQ